MKQLISFFEIPATDFDRAVAFYEKVFDLKLSRCECGDEKMGFFPDPEIGPRGAVSLAKGFDPAPGGVLISFAVGEIDAVLSKVLVSGGGVVIPRTLIDAAGQGYFGVFTDSEGNRIGLHSQS